MTKSLVISVRLYDSWYHGSDSPPSPARLYQALIAGRGLSGPLPKNAIEALEWLEQQPPPIMATPVMKQGQAVATYVPNNDLDSKRGDHRRIGEIRTKKSAQPMLFDSSVPFVYCWDLPDDADDTVVEQICELADGVYQLGRTVDAAWAWADVLSDEEIAARLREHRGPILTPAGATGSVECPTPGTLQSLVRRHDDMALRYGLTTDRKGQTFRRRSKPKWNMVSYDNTDTRESFDLIDRESSKPFAWPTPRVTELVTTLRDQAVAALVEALPDREPEINQTLVGRKPNGQNAGLVSARVRIIPLPSIGHQHADQQIRRVLVEIPDRCPLRADDILWAFSGQQLSTGGFEIDVVRAQPHRQLKYYGVSENASCHWQSVTPIALSSATRRHIEPDRRKRQPSDSKSAPERRFEQEVATASIRQALRHAGVETLVRSIRLQREPFTGRGERVEHFVTAPRFSKHGLWHVEIEFTTAVSGPIVIGDGRFLGLGLMRPIQPGQGAVGNGGGSTAAVFAFDIESGLHPGADSVQLARALRRAVMARVQDEIGPDVHLPTYFSAHYSDGSPAKSERTPHLAFQFDPGAGRLLIIAPRSSSKFSSDYLRTLDAALADFRELRAGRVGQLRISQTAIDSSDKRLHGPSVSWESVTAYTVNRHAKRATAEQTLRNDIIVECQRRGLPRPNVTIIDWQAQSGTGLSGTVRLAFQHAVSGPVILGKTRHLGGGLFVPSENG